MKLSERFKDGPIAPSIDWDNGYVLQLIACSFENIEKYVDFDFNIMFNGESVNSPGLIHKYHELNLLFLYPFRHYSSFVGVPKEVLECTINHLDCLFYKDVSSIPKEKLCQRCQRPNDIGVSECWWCGENP